MSRIGIVTGAFDILHPGYIELFRFAKIHCDILYVAIHVDPSVENPNKPKPVFSADERAKILMSIKYVNTILFYNTEEELEKIMLDLKFDVRILGSDYRCRPITGKELVPIIFHERTTGWSETKVRQLIKEAEK